MNLIEKMVSSLAVSLLTVGLTAVPITASAAAATCVLGTPTVTPSARVVIGTSGVLKRTLTVRATNCSAAAAKGSHLWWVMDVGDLGDIGEPGWPRLKPTTSGHTTTFRATLDVALGNAIAGDRPTAIWGTSKKLKAAPTLHLRRSSKVSVDVELARGYGSVVNKGDHLEIYPWLRRANWDYGKYSDYNNVVSLQFRTMKGHYRTIKTSSDSPFFTHASVDGCYRFVWKGNATTAASTSSGQCVNVK